MNKKRALINKAEKQQQESKETQNRNHWGQRRKVVTKCKAKQSSNQKINKKSKKRETQGDTVGMQEQNAGWQRGKGRSRRKKQLDQHQNQDQDQHMLCFDAGLC